MLKNVRIGTKLVGGFCVVALIVLVVGFVGWNGSRELGNQIEEIGLVRLPSIESLLYVEINLEELMVAQRSLLSEQLSSQQRSSYLQSWYDARASYRDEWEFFLTLPATAEEERLSRQFQDEIADWARLNDQWLELNRSFEALHVLDPSSLLAHMQQFRGDHYAIELEIATLLTTGQMFSGGDDAAACDFGRWLEGFTTENPTLLRILRDVRGPHNVFHQTAGQIRDLVSAGNSEGALAAFTNTLLPSSQQVFGYLYEIIAVADQSTALRNQITQFVLGPVATEAYEAVAVLDEIIHINEEIADAAVLEATAAGARAEMTAIVGMIAGLVIALLLGITIAIGITRPVGLSVKFAQQIALGELDIELPIRQKDEIGILADAMREMLAAIKYKAEVVERIADGDLTVDIKPASDKDGLGTSLVEMSQSLNDLIGQVKEAVSQVSSGSSQVSQASQSLSQGATEQASSLEEIASSLNEINSQSAQNADAATEANSLARKAASDADAGNTRMKELVGAMGKINESSDEINKVVKMIDDIAFQINLLALNANVEAARAGKYGKGFAVVAEEVRNLAVRSAEAVKETTSMVNESIRNIETGTKSAEDTSKQLEEILHGAAKVAEFLGEIAVASREQAQGIEQINSGLDQIDQVTQANTASAEESASASEELAAQATQLSSMVGRFKLKNERSYEQASRSSGGGSATSHASRAPRELTAPKKTASKPKTQSRPGNGNGAAKKKPAEVIVLDSGDDADGSEVNGYDGF